MKLDGERPNSRLIKCPDCGHVVSDDAFACPGCGKVIGRPALERLKREGAKRVQEAAKRDREFESALLKTAAPFQNYLAIASAVIVLGALMNFIWLCGLGGSVEQFAIGSISSVVAGVGIIIVGAVKHPSASRANGQLAIRQKQQQQLRDR